MAHAKTLREQLGRVGASIQNIIDRAKSDGNRGLTSEERQQFHALEADYTAVEDSIKIAERGEQISNDLRRTGDPRIDELGLERIQDIFRLSPAQQRERKKNRHDIAFGNYIRNGIEGLDADEKQIMMAQFRPTAVQVSRQRG